MSGPFCLKREPLTSERFAPFGEVIERESAADCFEINEGRVVRYHDLARIETEREGGRPIISLFRAKPQSLPLVIRELERHVFGSQAFIPLAPVPWLVVVATTGHDGNPGEPALFVPKTGQGVNYAPGTWHLPLLALAPADFLVIDRDGPTPDLEFQRIPGDGWCIPGFGEG